VDQPHPTPISPSAIEVNDAANRHFSDATTDERGAIFTRREVVDFILDLAGYTEAHPLHRARLLEPSAGEGDFLLPIIGRLVRSFRAHGGDLADAGDALAEALVAVEVHASSLHGARTTVANELRRLGVPDTAAQHLAASWLVLGDFLQVELLGQFTHVVGNPPYVRQELIPEALLAEYRARYRTLYDRADLYVPFFERSLDLLAPGGRLAFICTDRWTKNKYGGPLRELVASRFALTHYVDLLNADAFTTEVMTYPAITVIERPARPSTERAATRVAYQPPIEAKTLQALAEAMTAPKLPKASGVLSLERVANGSEPWLLHDPARLTLIRRLEASLPTLEQAGCKVGIGVATGNDRVYIAPMDVLNVEPGRALPLVRTQDLVNGAVSWQGMAVLNPFEDSGRVVDLDDYPRFAGVIRLHETAIKARNVAKRNATGWFRTIDRIYPSLARQPKLLIPDIKGDAVVVYEPGKLYPHHNLYYITAESWDLQALQAVLLAGVARLFVGSYSTPMRGGFLRFQAQYLRRIRVPHWRDVPEPLRETLREAGRALDLEAARRATFELYQLTPQEQHIIATA
jgi:hypothetical protein